MRMSARQAANFCGAELLHPMDILLKGAASDNRNVRPGDLFVALKGEKTDGHLFAEDAVRAGASAILAERNPFTVEPPVPVLLVPDSAKALGDIAVAWRKNFSGTVIAVTGTAGKTTTREILASVFSQRGKTMASPKNLNTQVGMPVTMLNADGDEDFWVLELGISHEGDMEELGSIALPDAALVLNAGIGHALGLGKDGAAKHKSKIFRYLSSNGIGLTNADYPDLVRFASEYPGTRFFSTKNDSIPFFAEWLGVGSDGKGKCRLDLENSHFEVSVPFANSYLAENILAAASLAHLLGITEREIQNGIASFQLPKQRFASLKIGNWTVIDDTYNANPLSCKKMVEAAAELGGNLVCVMGEMLELGDEAESGHFSLGEQLAASGCGEVFWFGDHAKDVARGLTSGHFSGNFLPFKSLEEFSSAVSPLFRRTGDNTILFKGSRGNRLERMSGLFIDGLNHVL